MILVTYLPFYRLHEVASYFVKNAELVRPERAVAFIDNVFNEGQREVARRVLPEGVEYVFGNWGSRDDTWIAMLEWLRSSGVEGDALFVDSDNVLTGDFPKVHRLLLRAAEENELRAYGVMDLECWEAGAGHFLRRSELSDVVGVFSYRVYDPRFFFKGGNPFFWGPKQAVYLGRLPDEELVEGLASALSRVTPYLRNLLSDESLLGVMAWLSGVERIPWTAASHHLHHGSGRAGDELSVARAHAQFAEGLWRAFRKWEFLAYSLKYKAIVLREAIKGLF
jgi:hypothetical protein